MALPQQVRGPYILIDNEQPLDRFCRFWRGGAYAIQGLAGDVAGWTMQGYAQVKRGISHCSQRLSAGWLRKVQLSQFHWAPSKSSSLWGPGTGLEPCSPSEKREACLKKAVIHMTKSIAQQQLKCLQLKAEINYGCHLTDMREACIEPLSLSLNAD